MTHRITRLLAVIAATAAMVAPASMARAQDGPGALHLLDVPYLPQSEALCGGAAVAMVMRYWGATGVYADTFAPLVDQQAGGIRGEALLNDLRARGWSAESMRGDAASIRQQLAARHPAIALIEDRPSRYHYVVIVGWSAGRVILHDPARAPFRVLDEAAFVRAWRPTGFWTMIAIPPEPRGLATGGATVATSIDDGAGPCQGLVDEGVRLAGAGDLAEARRRFDVAASTCPGSAAPWRERAGLHALSARWPDAASDAREALARDPHDEQAIRILATALYLEGDSRGALAAWNALGEPRIDLVNVKGLERTRFAVAAAAIDAEPGSVLTPAALDRAARRLGELPAAQVTRLAYRPLETGRAQVDAVVIERPAAPTGRLSLAAIGARALTDRELVVTMASPSGGGEAWRAAWRWWEHRPRVALAFDAPAPFGGTWGVEAAYDRQSYAGTGPTVEETRRTAAFHLSDWTGAALRWQVSAGVDSFAGQGRGLTLGGGLEQRLFDDRLAIIGRAGAWTASSKAWTGSVRAEWRSSTRTEGSVWLARAGLSHAGEQAPLAWWPGAGTGQGRDLLLRAHPLIDDGVIRDGVFGRLVVDAGSEWRAWRGAARGLLRVAPAVFIDTARAWRGLPDGAGRWEADAGAGLRLAVPGSGVIRVDVARGLRDGGYVLSAGWTR